MFGAAHTDNETFTTRDYSVYMYINSTACYVNGEKNARIIWNANSYLFYLFAENRTGEKWLRDDIKLNNIFRLSDI